MKKLLSLAIAAALVAPVAAMADATIYGKVRQSFDMVNDERNQNAEVDNFQINDRTSRLGVKGSEDLGNGLTGVYKIEYEVHISTNPDDGKEFAGDGSLGARNAFVGLAGGFGTFVIGRHDTPLKISTASLDYFGDTIIDNNKDYTEYLQDRRADGTIAYISPSLGGIATIAAALVPGENNEADGIADAYSLAAMFSYAGGYASLAYEGADGNIDAIHTDKADLTQIRAGLGYDGGMFKVGFVYETMTADNPGPGDDLIDSTSMSLNGGVKLGSGMLVAKYFDYENEGSVNPGLQALPVKNSDDHDGFGIGYHFDMSKRTQLMANYVKSSFDKQDGDVSIFSLQVNHDF
ncbi:MAG: porin [Candidatus Thiodiazotropha sp.]